MSERIVRDCPECGELLKPFAKRCPCGWVAGSNGGNSKPSGGGNLECAHPDCKNPASMTSATKPEPGFDGWLCPPHYWGKEGDAPRYDLNPEDWRDAMCKEFRVDPANARGMLAKMREIARSKLTNRTNPGVKRADVVFQTTFKRAMADGLSKDEARSRALAAVLAEAA